MQRSEVERLVLARQLAASGEARRIRLAAGLSLNDIATQAEVTAAAVWKWETGARRPSGVGALKYLRTLERLRALTGASA
jgi:DNA-binding transcriptional regulator YiaG